MSRLFQATVIENRLLSKAHYLLTLRPLHKIQQPEPGNFFMLSVNKGNDPLLKRPFSIHQFYNGDIKILYRVVGKGTELLSNCSEGSTLEALGPLGNKFPVPSKKKRIILVAGGMGVAPLFYLAEKLKKRGPVFFYGARTADEVLLVSGLKSLGIIPTISTDDGSLGKKGNIISVLNKSMLQRSESCENLILYACGPEPMLKALSRLSNKLNIPCNVSVEQHMACGIGTCLGCIVKTHKGHKRVCREGPVFKSDDIVWD